MDAVVHRADFLSEAELEALRARVESRMDLLRATGGRAGLGPCYRVLGGDGIAEHLPELVEFGRRRVQPALEELAGRPLEPLGSVRRSMRVQVYERREHGFRWHRDGHGYVALVALENSNGGQTQVLSPRLSRLVKYLLYPLYPLPQLWSLLPRSSVTLAPGDLLAMRGRDVVHRGVTLHEHGRRVLLAYTYNEPGHRPSRVQDRIARWLNY